MSVVVDGRVVDGVTALLRAVADEVVLPRWRSLGEEDLRRKAGGELVTVADVEAEARLVEGLVAIRDGLVVGEEGASADPDLLLAAPGAARCWVVDPIDGTRHFAAGEPDFAVMVALVEDDETVAAWIHQPAHDRLFHAVRGGGAFVDGRPLAPLATCPATGVVALSTRLLAPDAGGRVHARRIAAGWTDRPGPAGLGYTRLAEGQIDAVLMWRTRPWDHVPGALLVEEAGGVVSRLDGSPYRPWSEERGILATRGPAAHAAALDVLAPDGEI